MAFSILYGHSGPRAKAYNLGGIALYIDSFAEALGLKEFAIDPTRLQSVAAELIRPDFPHKDGVEKASPFKKVAHFFVHFVSIKPIIDPLPIEAVGLDIGNINNHQNVVVGYLMAIDALHGAEIYRDDDRKVTLTERIRVSKHFFRDFVEAYSSPIPRDDFKKTCLLFEQLAYRRNKDAPYDEVI